jgi:membrane protein YqaA with SNARE-associated domain
MRTVVKILIWLVAVAFESMAVHILQPLPWWRILLANVGFTIGGAVSYFLLADFLERRKNRGED